ncbi:serum response factor-like isoform X2 [Scleropages formosus]|uniref:Serum response factor n=1 Tax=Scleropages formosus TaxID=113540 RepID=A0A8C9TQ75_SCLFO|nr:serum response factor isoform X2 [Scleropages formosus]
MLPSQAGSAHTGNGSTGARESSAAGLRSGSGSGLARRGLIEVAARPADGAAMLGGNGAGGVGSRPGARQGNGAAALGSLQGAGAAVGIGAMSLPCGSRYETDRETVSQGGCSGSEPDSDLGEDDDPISSSADVRRGVKRERADMEAAVAAAAGSELGLPPGSFAGAAAGVAGAKPGKKTRGRVKIEMAFIDNKLRRYTTFSKRKTGIMKKAYELSTLTGTQVLLLVASETGHVYTFATRKLQPMITSETGKALIQTCLNSPDSPPRSDPSSDQRMSATGFEETDLTYQVSESDSCTESKDPQKPTFTVASLPGTTSSTQPGVAAGSAATTTSGAAQAAVGGPSFPMTTCWPISAGANTNSMASANGTVLKAAGGSGSVMQLPSGFTLMSGGAVPQPLQAIQVHPGTQQSAPVSTSDSTAELSQASSSSTVSLPATIVTSSVPTSMAGHMMYPSPHAVMYAPTPTLADGGLAVLNAFPQAGPGMQVSHTQPPDTGAIPQVFLTAPSGAVQIPVSAVQLHPMVIGQQTGGSSTNLTELQVVNLDAPHGGKSD